MLVTPDLFGTVLLEYFEGLRVPSHLRRGDGRLSLLEVARYFAPSSSFTHLEQALLREARGDTLDLGAGAGRVALYLEEQSLREARVGKVVAVDRSPHACACMRRRGVSTVMRAAWEDLAGDLNMRSRFDTITLLGAGLGMAGSQPGLERLLLAIRRMLRPAGFALVTASAGPAGTNLPVAVRLRVESRGRIGEWFNWLHVSPPALRLTAERSGLTIVREPLCDAGGEYGAVLRRAPRAGEWKEAGACYPS